MIGDYVNPLDNKLMLTLMFMLTDVKHPEYSLSSVVDHFP